jgi:hypothetical protein
MLALQRKTVTKKRVCVDRQLIRSSRRKWRAAVLIGEFSSFATPPTAGICNAVSRKLTENEFPSTFVQSSTTNQRLSQIQVISSFFGNSFDDGFPTSKLTFHQIWCFQEAFY